MILVSSIPNWLILRYRRKQDQMEPIITDARIKAYRMDELACLYEVDKGTLRRWLRPFSIEIGPRLGYYYTPAQVKIIFKNLGVPDAKVIQRSWRVDKAPGESTLRILK